jgi:hypothetical protein
MAGIATVLFSRLLDPHIVVQCTAVDISFMLTIFKEGVGNGFLWPAEMHCI